MRFIAEIQQSDGYNSVVWNVTTDSFEMLRQTVLALVWEGPSTEDLVPLEEVSNLLFQQIRHAGCSVYLVTERMIFLSV
jgi:hypothetical protein